MSKQPRGNVRVGAGNTAGARVSNIFVDVEKFQSRFQEAKEKASKHSKVSLTYVGEGYVKRERMAIRNCLHIYLSITITI